MDERTIQRWVDIAVRQIKFPPDRKAVRQELWDHLLDSREYHMERGMDLKTAEAAAVAAMGDPAETGRMLNKIHRPWLGQLWWASRCVLAITICFAIGAALNHSKTDIFDWDGMLPSLVEDWELNGCQYASGRYLDAPYTEIPVWSGDVEQAGVYTLTLDHGSWVITEDRQRLTLGFRVEAEHLLDLDPVGFGARLLAEDDLGNRYAVRPRESGSLNGISSSAYPWSYLGWREPYVHLLFSTDDGLERNWIRFYVPDTEFDITVDSEGRVVP